MSRVLRPSRHIIGHFGEINKSAMPKAMLGVGAEGVAPSTVGFWCHPQEFLKIQMQNSEFWCLLG